MIAPVLFGYFQRNKDGGSHTLAAWQGNPNFVLVDVSGASIKINTSSCTESDDLETVVVCLTL